MRRIIAWLAFLLSPALLSAQNPLGNTLLLDGQDDRMIVSSGPNLNFDAGEPFTIEMRFRSESGGQTHQVLLVKYLFRLPEFGYQFRLDPSGTMFAELRSPQLPFQDGLLLQKPHPFEGGNAPTYGSGWHHLAYLYDGTTYTLFLDGLTDAIQSFSPDSVASISNSNVMAVGIQPHVNRFAFGGEIDELRIWNVARTTDEIRQFMADTVGPDLYRSADSVMAAYYRFDKVENLGVGEPGINDIRDLSLYGSHGDLLGGPMTTGFQGEAYSSPRLTLLFENMTQHVGQKLEARVIDIGTGEEVARHTVPEVTDANFEIWMNALVINRRYRVDVYADHNENGSYDPPEVDHAWRLEVDPAVGNDTLTFDHNGNFVDIGWVSQLNIRVYEAIWTGLVNELNRNLESPLSLHIRVNLDSASANGALEVQDLLRVTAIAALSFAGDSVRAEPGVAAGKASDWTGGFSFTNNGRFKSDIIWDSAGVDVDLTSEGTLGATQMMSQYESKFLDARGFVFLREDSVITKTVVSIEAAELPAKPSIRLQIFPNPFDDVTTIQYELPATASISMEVYDYLGRRVDVLAKGVKVAGLHATRLRSDEMPSGVYFCRLVTRNASGESAITTSKFSIVR